MSEFSCANGHLCSCRDHKCPICGLPITRMDGKTGLQWLKEEKREWARENGMDYEEMYGDE